MQCLKTDLLHRFREFPQYSNINRTISSNFSKNFSKIRPEMVWMLSHFGSTILAIGPAIRSSCKIENNKSSSTFVNRTGPPSEFFLLGWMVLLALLRLTLFYFYSLRSLLPLHRIRLLKPTTHLDTFLEQQTIHFVQCS